MDRRSWLWRRKSSDTPAQRFSDDQTFLNHRSQSPEVISKADTADVEVYDNVKILEEKLSSGVMNTTTATQDLVKQHAKVAEEAVSGWEKAEKEVFALKQQLDASLTKNSALDSALKDCVRQLRQARDEQGERANEWENAKSRLESQIKELQYQLQICKAEVGRRLVDPDLQKKLVAVEEENSVLKLELLSQAEELELRIIERDLSTQAAETASKQHLESVKKLSKLEAECRRLKAAAAYKVPYANILKLDSASSISIESLADSQSDGTKTDIPRHCGFEMNGCETTPSNSWTTPLVTEINQYSSKEKAYKNSIGPSVEINLMDDFLEMERLAALPDTHSSSSGFNKAGPPSAEPLKAELEILINRTSELEENLEKIESENLELKMALTESQKELERLKDQLMAEERKCAELQTQLTFSNNSRQAAEKEMKAESRHREAALEIKDLNSKVALLEEEIAKEHAFSAENIAKLKDLEDRLSNTSIQAANANSKREVAESRLIDAELEIKTLLSTVNLLEEEVKKGCALSAENIAKREELENELSKVEEEKSANIQTLVSKVAFLEEEVAKERALSAENIFKYKELEDELSTISSNKSAGDEEVRAANKKIQVAESELREAELEIKTLRTKVALLEEEIEKERALSAENIMKCNKLENEVSKMNHEAALQTAAVVNNKLKIKQDKELALAASRFAECQKTIASLGQQLKSLATMEDFLIDKDKQPLEAMLLQV